MFFARHSSPHLFFKLPEKGKLPKNKAIEKQDHVVDREDEQVVADGKPQVFFTSCGEKGNNGVFEQHDRESCAGKYDQYDDDLQATIEVPTFL